MVGGFLGAGKTTAVASLAQALKLRGLKVGLITNDQGSNMVDTAMLRSRGFATEEIPGGCFCCRFNSLVEAAGKLTSTTAPDVFIAEPVGSCTDLIATVTYPLRRMYGDQFSVAPLSVMLDPIRALRIFGVEEGSRFSDKVRYIYLKQIEESDLIVINKVDVVSSGQVQALKKAITTEVPGKRVIETSARLGIGMRDWLDKILEGTPKSGEAIQVNYETYAEGEALLGWLNCTVRISGTRPWNGNDVLRDLAAAVHRRLKASGAEVAHLKMTLSTEAGLNEIAVINLVRNDYVPELSLELSEPLTARQLIINARVEMAPEQILSAVCAGLDELSRQSPDLQIRMEHEEHFRPGKPQPTHRLAALAD